MLKLLADLITPIDPIPTEPVSHFWPIFWIVAGVVGAAAALIIVLVVLKKKKNQNKE